MRHTRYIAVRSTLALSGIYLLVLLLALTFPLGAGDAEHGGALLHPAFGHVHGAGGERSRASSVRASQNQPKMGLSLGAAIDAGAGGASEFPTTGMTPSLARLGLWLPMARPDRLSVVESATPQSLLEPPPDPPPTSLT